jgi:hypothetical protein
MKTVVDSRRHSVRAARKALRAAAIVACVAVSWAAPAAAQVEMSAPSEPIGAVFRGQVVDSLTGEPIEGVLITMDVGDQAFSDARGEFRFGGLPEGKRLFAMLTADCRVTWAQVTVVEGIPRSEQFRLPPAFGAAAQAEAEQQERRQSTSGRRLGVRELEASRAANVMELIRQIAPNMLTPMRGDGGVSEFRSARGRSTGTTDPPVVVIDGVRTTGAENMLASMRLSEIAELEVQPGAAAGWEYGSAGASGVIKITLRRGLPDGAQELRDPAQCRVPTFPRG